MAVTDVLAGTVVAEPPLWYTLAQSRVLARDHLDVANLAGPSGRALALVLVALLQTCRLILAGRLGAPVDVALASFSGETVWTVAGVVLHVIVASRAVLAWTAVALVDAVLAVGACVARSADASVVVDAVDAGAAVHAG